MVSSTLIFALAGMAAASSQKLGMKTQKSPAAHTVIQGISLYNPLALRQSGCDFAETECDGGCIPLLGECCESGDGGWCDIGTYCSGGGCCDIGEICSGPPSGCDDDQDLCGDYCIPGGSVCCFDGEGFCDPGETCTTDGLCETGGSGGGGGGGSGSSCDDDEVECDDGCMPTDSVCCFNGYYCAEGETCAEPGFCDLDSSGGGGSTPSFSFSSSSSPTPTPTPSSSSSSSSSSTSSNSSESPTPSDDDTSDQFDDPFDGDGDNDSDDLFGDGDTDIFSEGEGAGVAMQIPAVLAGVLALLPLAL